MGILRKGVLANHFAKAQFAWAIAWRLYVSVDQTTPIERAKADLNKLNAEISRLHIQVKMTESRRDKVRAYIEMAEFYESEDAAVESARPRGGVSGAAVRASAEAIRERKKHIHTRELLDILARQGIQVGGSNPAANLSGFLSRSDELKNSRSHGWGLAEWGDVPDEQPSTSVDQVRTRAGAVLQKLEDPDALSPVPEAELDEEIPF